MKKEKTKKELEVLKLANTLFDNLLVEGKDYCIVYTKDKKLDTSITNRGKRAKGGKAVLRVKLGVEYWELTLADWFKGGAEESYRTLITDDYKDDFIDEILVPLIEKGLGGEYSKFIDISP